MKLEQQVASLELSKRLKELGVEQKSLFWWKSYNGGLSFVLTHAQPVSKAYTSISAFTVAELGEMLPARLTYDRAQHPVYRLASEKQDTRWNIVYLCADCKGRNFEPILADTEADARAKMLIYLLENKLITI